MKPIVSFVIPALNEEQSIGDTLKCIRRQMQSLGSYEMILVDNGSIDRTPEIARDHGAEVCILSDVTVAALRNRGASVARGEIFIFLDADVRLTEDWGHGIRSALAALRRDSEVITGSLCVPPERASWIEKVWFAEGATEKSATHIGSGHMILTRQLFQRLGGFNERLVTGEDYDICRRASAAGGRIVNDRSLVVTHQGYPRTIPQFVRREAWHGTSDFTSWSIFIRSPVALATAAFAGLHGVFFVSVFWPGTSWIAVVAPSLVVALMLASSFYKYSHSRLPVRLITAVIFYPYYMGRTIALLRAVASPFFPPRTGKSGHRWRPERRP